MYLISILSLLYSVVSLNAQDFILDFTASGASSSLSSVIIENLTRGTTLTVNGSDQVRLSSQTTGIATYHENIKQGISFIPNPMKDNTRIQFNLPESGYTVISVYDISGRKVSEHRNYLPGGHINIRISDLNYGIYLVSVKSDRYSCSGRLISFGSGSQNPTITIEEGAGINVKNPDTKGLAEELTMLYSPGEILKLTGISGDYSTIITDSPSGDKTINFNFIECRDASGNNYTVVMIGSAKGDEDSSEFPGNKGVQIWMGENLKTTTFNDGTPINNVTSNSSWSQLSSSAYCFYDNVINDYGLLYNWYTVGTGKLCPTGWRVPSDDDWTALIQYLGGATVAGGKLKESGTSHWENPNSGATNSSGFTALPGGYRLNTDGSFGDKTKSGWWWTSTSVNITNACYRTILSIGSQVYGFMSEVDQKFGFSVRCIKNNP